MPPLHSFTNELVAAMAQPAALLDRSGVILHCNSGFYDCLSITTKKTIGTGFAQLLRPENRSAVTDFMDKGVGEFAASVELPSGNFRLGLQPLNNGGQTQFLCQFTPDHAIDSSRLRFLLEHLDQGVWNFNVLTGTFNVTDAWRRMRGMALDTIIDADGSGDWINDIHPDDRENLLSVFRGQTRGEAASIDVQFRHKAPNGGWIWILSRASVMSWDQNGKPVQIVGLDTDITEIKDNEAALAKLSNKLQLAIEVAGIGVWEFDEEETHVAWDQQILNIYGISRKQFKNGGNRWESYLHPDDLERMQSYADYCFEHNQNYDADFRIIRGDGEVRHIRARAQFVNKTSGSKRLLGVNMDITDDVLRELELESARQKLEHDSRHDALTGLANRRLLDETTQALMARLGPDDRYGVLHLDLDHFKQINDTLGHAAGDAVLVQVADVLISLVGDAGLVCRNGGDEFVVLLEDVNSEEDVHILCGNIIKRVAEPLVLQGHESSFGVSIGGAIGGGGSGEASETFINADVALYAAKSDGRSRFRLFRPGMRPAAQGDMGERAALLKAINEGEIACYFQPQFDARTFKLIGAEALVRWHCPERGTLLPDQFIPTARQSGLLARIDDFVLQEVLRNQTLWSESGLDVPIVSLNMTLERLQEEGMVARVAKGLRSYHALSFELLETSFLDDADTALAVTIDGLRAIGIRLELDDFGAGHSSIVALQAIQPDRVKIDRRLVAPLCKNRTQILTLQALTRLASLEGAQVVVEGIETEEQLAAISQLDCEALQGFALAHPMTGEAFARHLTLTQAVMQF